MAEPLHYKGYDGWPLFACRVAEPDEGDGPPVVLLHGGGPDHQSLLPLARRLADIAPVVLPDVRGYGRSICRDPRLHTWSQYADDIAALLDHLGTRTAIVGGAGLGGTIALRTALRHPDRVQGLVVMSLEDIEDDDAKAAEIRFMDKFAWRVRSSGLRGAWGPVLPHLAPVIGTMVEEAMPRADPSSIAAAAAIGHDRSFRNLEELSPITVPALVFPGMDWRHPAKLAEAAVDVLPQGRLAEVSMNDEMSDAEDFARALAKPIRDFLASCGLLR